MKKIAFILVGLILLTCFVGCGNNKQDTELNINDVKLKSWYYENLTENECHEIENAFNAQIQAYNNMNVNNDVVFAEYNTDKMLNIVKQIKEKYSDFPDEGAVIVEMQYINTDIVSFNFENEPTDNDYKTKFEDFRKEIKQQIDNIIDIYFE